MSFGGDGFNSPKQVTAASAGAAPDSNGDGAADIAEELTPNQATYTAASENLGDGVSVAKLDTTSNAVTVTGHNFDPNTNSAVLVFGHSSGSGVATLDPKGPDTIEGETTVTLQPDEWRIYIPNGTDYQLVAHGRLVSLDVNDDHSITKWATKSAATVAGVFGTGAGFNIGHFAHVDHDGTALNFTGDRSYAMYALAENSGTGNSFETGGLYIATTNTGATAFLIYGTRFAPSNSQASGVYVGHDVAGTNVSGSVSSQIGFKFSSSMTASTAIGLDVSGSTATTTLAVINLGTFSSITNAYFLKTGASTPFFSNNRAATILEGSNTRYFPISEEDTGLIFSAEAHIGATGSSAIALRPNGADSSEAKRIVRAEAETSDATQTVLASFTLDDTSVYDIEARVVCVNDDGTERGSFKFGAATWRTGGGAVLSAVTAYKTIRTTGTIAATFGVNSNDLRVLGTGLAGEDFDWVVYLEYFKVTE
jgi:hypothetical protein